MIPSFKDPRRKEKLLTCINSINSGSKWFIDYPSIINGQSVNYVSGISISNTADKPQP